MVALNRLVVLLATLLMAAPVRSETPNPHLPRARVLLEELRYAEATRALDEARAVPGNDRNTLLEILELQGVVSGMLQQPARARASFQTLLVLAPDYRLKGDYAPRVVTPFFEARAWVTDQQAALRMDAAPPSDDNPSAQPLAVDVKVDVLKLGRAVRFYIREPGEGWRKQEEPLAGGKASGTMKGARADWWAELLDERRAVLASVGSEAAPLVARTSDARALVPSPTAPGEGASEVKAPTSPLRIAAYACLGAAVGAGAVGGYSGWQSREARARVAGAPVNGDGVTTGLTQREAFALDERARSQGRLANILFGVAGAAAVAGGTLWVLGAPVTVSPTPTGVVVGGVFP